MNRIAIYLGDTLPPNLVRFLSGIGKLADDSFEFTVIGTGIDTAQLPSRFSYHDVPGKKMTRGISRLIATYRRVSMYLDSVDSNPDAIWQITTPQFHAVPTLIAARQRGVPVATRIPGNKFDEFREQPTVSDAGKTFLLNNVALRTLRYSTVVVALSDHNRENLIQRGIPHEKIRVLRPPLDTETFSPVGTTRKRELQDELGFDSDAHCILYVGRLSELKGMADFEEILAHYQGDGYEFHFVGTGEFASTFEKYDNTVMHGFIKPHRLHRYYKAADILAHPSYIEEEGISWTMIEAAASGLPVVARDIENASTLSSFVFTDIDDLLEYLSDPTAWSPAPYPTKWSLDYLAPAYNNFFETLVADHEDGIQI